MCQVESLRVESVLFLLMAELSSLDRVATDCCDQCDSMGQVQSVCGRLRLCRNRGSILQSFCGRSRLTTMASLPLRTLASELAVACPFALLLAVTPSFDEDSLLWPAKWLSLACSIVDLALDRDGFFVAPDLTRGRVRGTLCCCFTLAPLLLEIGRDGSAYGSTAVECDLQRRRCGSTTHRESRLPL